MVAALMTSCIKSDEKATGVGDVLIVSKKSGEDTVYGLSLYAYTFSSFQSVTADSSGVGDHIFTLKPNQGYKTNFYYETPEAEFTTTKPAAATFNFSSVFENGTVQEFQDVLSSKALLPPVIDSCKYSSTEHLLKINWATVTDADTYTITILDGSTLVFGSPEFDNTYKAFSISTEGIGWASGFTPVSGKTYTVRLFAFLYESGANSYNVQASTLTDTTVVWGN